MQPNKKPNGGIFTVHAQSWSLRSAKKSWTEISAKKLRFSRAVKTSTAKTCWEKKQGQMCTRPGPFLLMTEVENDYDPMTLCVEKTSLGGTHVQLPWWEKEWLQLVMSPRWVELTFWESKTARFQASTSVAKLAAWVGMFTHKKCLE